jgi:hypothetical protein
MMRLRIGLGLVVLIQGAVGLACGQRIALLAALLFAPAPHPPFDRKDAPPAPDDSRRSAWTVFGGDMIIRRNANDRVNAFSAKAQ